MAEEPNKLWRLALVVSLLLLAVVAYYRFEPVRAAVDAKCPWIKEQLAQHGIQLEETSQTAPAAAPAKEAKGTSLMGDACPAAAKPGATASTQPTPTQPATTAASANLPSNPADIAQIAADRSLWPKAVRIKKATEFPAVNQGKEIGKLSVPAGTEVKLITITADKVGVAYSPDGTMPNAGGKWLLAEETDLLERVRIAHAGH